MIKLLLNKDFTTKDQSTLYLAGAITILSHLAGEDVPEGGEGIVHGLVVDTLVQILDEDVADSRSSQRRITLTPHDPDGAALQNVKVHGVESTLGWTKRTD